MKTTIVTFAAIPLCLSGVAQGASPSRQAATALYGKLPLSFEPNRGQTGPGVQFLARGAGYTVLLSPTSAVVALRSGAIRMDLVGAGHAAGMNAEDKLPGISNYLMGSTRTVNVPTYAKARVRSVYPGIDLVYYGTQGQLEYDYVLAPGADPSRIRMTFVGATPAIDGAGDLVLPLGTKDSGSDIRFHKPVLYQLAAGVRRPVSGRFTIAAKSHEVGFQVDSYDHGRELVIDPVLAFSSYLGASAYPTQIAAIALNAAGDIYVTGNTLAIGFPTTPGVIEPACPSFPTIEPGNPLLTYHYGCKFGFGENLANSAFVSKISADGQALLYSTFLGGAATGTNLDNIAVNNDYGTGIAVDSGDNAWVVGTTGSNDFPITPATAFQPNCNPEAPGTLYTPVFGSYCGAANYGVFLVQLNPTGTTELYGTFLNGTGWSIGGAQIAIDGSGNIYVAGTVYNPNPTNFAQFVKFPSTASAYQTAAPAQNFSAFVTEFAPGGQTLIYSTLFGGLNQSATTLNNALAVGGGKIFIGGQTNDPELPTKAGALSRTCVTNQPGETCSANATQGYVAEFDPTKAGAASLVFSTYLNGSILVHGDESSQVFALAADTAGNSYAGGFTTYSAADGFPATAGALQPTCALQAYSKCSTGFVTKLSQTGSLVWSTFYGSPTLGANPNGALAAIALDSADDVYITGNADGLGDIPLHNGFQGYNSGVAYVTELNSNGSQVLFGSFYGGGTDVYPGAMTVDTWGNIYLAGYTNANLPLVNALETSTNGGNQGFFAKIEASTSPKPFGSFDTPAAASSNVSGSVGFTGWALSEAGVSSVGIYRDPNPGETTQSNGLVYIGTASSITGSRPDVAAKYPNYPANTSAGWGFLILTNELPSNGGNTGVGNGTYTIHAIANDIIGNSTDLGVKTIVVDNKDATAPFGAIDTPAQGGTIAGTKYVNFGWALTPQPKSIPTNGSTIVVYIDGKPMGHPVYNNARSDIETLFPGYANTDGAVGYLKIDTTTLTNGLHSISWGVTDSAGQKSGIGSRFFIVQN